jgi:uncharacterized protein
MKTVLALAIATCAFAALAPAADAASFRCSGRLTATEAAICGNGQLSRLDSEMASTYFRAINAVSPALRKRLQRDQVQWLGSRNACGGNAGCLTALYNDRLNTMYGWGG